jgi:hypothetical protein
LSTMSDLGFKWEKAESTNACRSFQLKNIDHNNEAIVTVQFSADFYSIFWLSELPYYKFLNCLANIFRSKRVPRCSKIDTTTLLVSGDYITSKTYNVNKYANYENIFLALDAKSNFVRSRIEIDSSKIFYEPMEDNLLRLPNIAVVSNDDNFRLALGLFQETCVDYIPIQILKRELQKMSDK